MEHRTTKDDLVPPWYKRGSYIIILAIIVFIAAYAIYLLVLAPRGAPATINDTSCAPACGDVPGQLVQVLFRTLGF